MWPFDWGLWGKRSKTAKTPGPGSVHSLHHRLSMLQRTGVSLPPRAILGGKSSMGTGGILCPEPQQPFQSDCHFSNEGTVDKRRWYHPFSPPRQRGHFATDHTVLTHHHYHFHFYRCQRGQAQGWPFTRLHIKELRLGKWGVRIDHLSKSCGWKVTQLRSQFGWATLLQTRQGAN